MSKDKEMVEARKLQMKAEHRCLTCGTPLGEDKHLTCSFCRGKVRWNRQQVRKKRLAQGLCSVCGKRPATPEMFTCEACRQYQREHKQKERRGGV